MANDSKNTDNIDAFLAFQPEMVESDEMVDYQRQQSIKQLQSNGLLLRKQVEEECAAHRIAVELHKKLIRQIQAVNATNEQLLDCFLQTEVILQKEKDVVDKKQIQTKNQLKNLQTQQSEIEEDMEQSKQNKRSLDQQLNDTQKVLQRQSDKNDQYEQNISESQKKLESTTAALARMTEDLVAAEGDANEFGQELQVTKQALAVKEGLLQTITEQNTIKQKKIQLVQDTLCEIQATCEKDDTALQEYQEEIEEVQRTQLNVGQKLCYIKTVIANLKKENEFYFQTLSTITEMIVNLNANVVFCAQCKAAPSGQYQVEQCSIPDLNECSLDIKLQDYSAEIKKTNEQLSIYELPSIRLKEDDGCQ